MRPRRKAAGQQQTGSCSKQPLHCTASVSNNNQAQPFNQASASRHVEPARHRPTCFSASSSCWFHQPRGRMGEASRFCSPGLSRTSWKPASLQVGGRGRKGWWEAVGKCSCRQVHGQQHMLQRGSSGHTTPDKVIAPLPPQLVLATRPHTRHPSQRPQHTHRKVRAMLRMVRGSHPASTISVRLAPSASGRPAGGSASITFCTRPSSKELNCCQMRPTWRR